MSDKRPPTSDESTRRAGNETVNDGVRKERDSEPAIQIVSLVRNERERSAEASGQLERHSPKAAAGAENESEQSKVISRLSQVIDYLFYLVYGLLSLQILLDLFWTGRDDGFRGALTAVCAPLLARLLSSGAPDATVGAEQRHLSTFLLLFFLPQVVLYAFGGIATGFSRASEIGTTSWTA